MPREDDVLSGVILSQMGEAFYYTPDMIICFIMDGYAHFVKDNSCDN